MSRWTLALLFGLCDTWKTLLSLAGLFVICVKISSTRRDNLTTDTTWEASIVRSGIPQARIAIHVATIGNVRNRDWIAETQGTSIAMMRNNRNGAMAKRHRIGTYRLASRVTPRCRIRSHESVRGRKILLKTLAQVSIPV